MKDKMNLLEQERSKLRDSIVTQKQIEDANRTKLQETIYEQQRLKQLLSDDLTLENSLKTKVQQISKVVTKMGDKMMDLEPSKDKYGSMINFSDEQLIIINDEGISSSSNKNDAIAELTYALKAEENSKREELKILRQNKNKQKGKKHLQPVNYATLKAKLRSIATLQEQITSVEEAIKHLEIGIDEAVTLMKDTNCACFKVVSESFARQVAILLPGRVGLMRQTGTSLEDGISISFATSTTTTTTHQADNGDDASEVRGMNELSGGQKALVGLALTFSLSSFRQLPIYILDEIDAPLDEHNQAEAAAAVAKLFQGSQIICISHHTPFHKIADHIVQIGRENESSKLIGIFHQE
jgi:chromosome segregation protein